MTNHVTWYRDTEIVGITAAVITAPELAKQLKYLAGQREYEGSRR